MTAQANHLPSDEARVQADKIFVPHSETLQESAGILGELVPFSLDYVCLRLRDGTYAFNPVTSS